MVRQIGYIKKNVQGNRVYSVDDVSATLASQTGGLGGAGVSLIIDNELSKNKRKEDKNLTNTQTSTFESINEKRTVEKKPFKFIDLFSGIGGFHTALKEIGGECVFASEIDKFAKQAYEVLHGIEPYGDITKIDAKDIPDHDVIAAGFPCQSFSISGKRGGFEDARGTLFFEVARIASEKQPDVLLLENVKGLVGHDKGKTLDTIVKTLNEIGYRVDFEVLNSKYFGVPQNRERIFIVAVREDLVENEPWNIVGNTVVPKGKRRIIGYEDVKMFNFDWPTNDTVTTKLRDILEENVDEKYYISEEKTNQLVEQLTSDETVIMDVSQRGREGKARLYYDAAPTVAARDYKEPRMVGHVDSTGVSLAKQATEVVNVVDVSGTLMARDYKGFGNQEMTGVVERFQIKEESGDNQGVNLPAIGASRGRNIKNLSDGIPGNDVEQRLEMNSDDTSNTLTSVQKDNYVVEPLFRIRKLTPKECWRLQGFTDEQHDLVEQAGISNTQRYKQAGNAVTVNVIEVLGEKLLKYIL